VDAGFHASRSGRSSNDALIVMSTRARSRASYEYNGLPLQVVHDFCRPPVGSYQYVPTKRNRSVSFATRCCTNSPGANLDDEVGPAGANPMDGVSNPIA
jgi:hypothetical protein